MAWAGSRANEREARARAGNYSGGEARALGRDGGGSGSGEKKGYQQPATSAQTVANAQRQMLGLIGSGVTPGNIDTHMTVGPDGRVNKTGGQSGGGGGGGGLDSWIGQMLNGLVPTGDNMGILQAFEPIPGVGTLGQYMGDEAQKVVDANPDKVFKIDGKPAGAFVDGKVYSSGGTSFSEVDQMRMMRELSNGNMNLNGNDIARLNDGGEFGKDEGGSMEQWQNQMMGMSGAPGAPTTPGTTTPDPTREETITKVRETALTNAMLAAHNRGLNPADYSELFTGEIDRLLGQMSDVTDPTTLFTPNFGSTTLDTEQGRRRSVYGNEIQNYAPSGFETSRIASTADDDIISRILAEQEAPARTYLDYAKARGNLNDVGYNTGLQDLAGQRTAGGSTLSSIGDSILNRYRGDLTSAKDAGVAGAAGYTLGSTFDPASFNSNIDTLTGERLGGLEGDIRGSTGSSGLFDTSRLLSRAGTQQGAQNETGSLFDVLANRRKTRGDQRGLGSRGEF